MLHAFLSSFESTHPLTHPSSSSEDLGAGPLHFIILDSTWPQAYTLRKWFLFSWFIVADLDDDDDHSSTQHRLSKKDKSLQEVKVSPSSESQFVVRKRIAQVEGQICTLEAVVLLLEVSLSFSTSPSPKPPLSLSLFASPPQ